MEFSAKRIVVYFQKTGRAKRPPRGLVTVFRKTVIPRPVRTLVAGIRSSLVLLLLGNLLHSEGLNNVASPHETGFHGGPGFNLPLAEVNSAKARFCAAKHLYARPAAQPCCAGRRPGAAAIYKPLRLLGNLLHSEGLDNVAFLDIIELLNGHAALVAGGDLLHLVLKPLQGGQHTLVNNDAVPH